MSGWRDFYPDDYDAHVSECALCRQDAVLYGERYAEQIGINIGLKAVCDTLEEEVQALHEALGNTLAALVHLTGEGQAPLEIHQARAVLKACGP